MVKNILKLLAVERRSKVSRKSCEFFVYFMKNTIFILISNNSMRIKASNFFNNIKLSLLKYQVQYTCSHI